MIANPNAPTGIALGIDDIEKIVSSNRESIVIIDEAYVDFGCESAVMLTKKYDNLLVIQTLSKSRSLAGERVGFCIGNSELIAGLNCVKNSINSYTIDRLALKAAKAAFEDRGYFDETRNKIIATRQRTAESLEELGFDVLPSMANFIFAKLPGMYGGKLFQALRDEGILVRYFNKPGIDDRLRISIGTDEEMDELLKAVKKIIGRQQLA